MTNHAALFSNKINKLVEIGNRLTRSNVQLAAKLTQLQNRLVILVSAGGITLVIERVGSYLYRYQDKIIARDEDFFRSCGFLDNLSIKEEQAEVVKSFAAAMDTIYSTASKKEKDIIYDLIKGMLIDYIDYMLDAVRRQTN